MSEVQATKVTIEMFNELVERVKKLEEQVEKSRGQVSTREMSDDDAKRILNGDLAKSSHKDCAKTLELSYGQIYSCRGEYTFKHVHKVLKASGFKNPWVK